MQSKAKTVKQYLAELPPDRRAAISAVRDVILKNLDKGYEETMGYGAICYVVPHRVYPPGYHCDPKLPLPFAGIGSQKHYNSIGFMTMYSDPAETKWFVDAWKRSGKRASAPAIKRAANAGSARSVRAAGMRNRNAGESSSMLSPKRDGRRTNGGSPSVGGRRKIAYR